MANLLAPILEYFDECKIALAETFIPPYVASACNHLTNLENQKREFYLEHGRVANLRMHLFFCAPPGFMKSLVLQKMLDGANAALATTEIDHAFEGSMTEAGWTGTVRMMNDEAVTIFGAAHEHRKAIMGIEEFAALTNVLKMQHSINLDNAMLTSLDSGLLIKRLAMGKIQYLTQVTLWTGSQPARFDLTSGLGRRLFFIYFMPTRDQEEKIRQARRKAKNVFPSTKTMNKIEREIDKVVDAISRIRRIEFDDDLFRQLDRMKVPHFEEVLYERLALGYNLSVGQGDEVTHVGMIDSKLKGLFQIEKDWRSKIKRGALLSQVLAVVKETGYAPVNEIKEHLADLGIEWTMSGNLLTILEKQKAVRLSTVADKGKKGRSKVYVMPLE